MSDYNCAICAIECNREKGCKIHELATENGRLRAENESLRREIAKMGQCMFQVVPAPTPAPDERKEAIQNLVDEAQRLKLP